MRYEQQGIMTVTRWVAVAVLSAVALGALTLGGKIGEYVNADEIVIMQDPVDGELSFIISPGLWYQNFGTVTTYQKRDIYEFVELPIMFNDGGNAKLTGSIQFDMPLDNDNLRELHTRYGSPEAIKEQVIETVVNKVLYLTGPLMSSRESYAEKRTDLIRHVQDQVSNGVYQSSSRATEQIDPLSGQRTTQVVVDIALDATGTPRRQEQSVVGEFGIRAFNFAIDLIDYDERVETQIATQQQAIMDVQTAIAEARKAEQRKITTEQEGAANAAKAKWEQETIRAKAVVEAEQVRDVAALHAEAAEQYRREQILRADGDSDYKRRVMQADGALAQKLATLENINKTWADAFARYTGQMVPQVVMGGGGSSGASASTSVQGLMDLLMAKTARDLQLDMRPVAASGGRGAAGGGR